MIHIQDIKALEILDSRGNPTVQVTLATESFQAKSKVPSGASTGIHEALELRDQDPSRFHGKGVQKAIYNIMEVIRPEILGHEFSSQEEFDALLLKIDGTDNKQNLGANSILACSMAFNRLLAQAKEQELYQNFSDHFSLPTPMVNVLNGGQHADNGLEIQEFMIVPFGIEEFSEKIRAACEIFHCLKSLLKEQSKATSVGDEGGFAPKLGSNDEALQLLSKAVEQAGYKLKTQIGFDMGNQNDLRKRYNNNQGDIGKLVLNQKEKFQNIGFYIVNNFELNNFAISSGIRYDINKVKIQDMFLENGNFSDDINLNSFNPSLGINYRINKNSRIFINTSSGFETPTLNELSSSPIGSGFNKDLKSQINMGYEIGYSLFNNQKKLFTLYDQNSQQV